MESLFQIIGMAINYVVGQVSDALNADIKKRSFAKAGELQNAAIGDMQNRYSALEDALAEATVIKYQSQAEADVRKKVLSGNLVTAIMAIVITFVVIAAIMWIAKSSKK